MARMNRWAVLALAMLLACGAVSAADDYRCVLVVRNDTDQAAEALPVTLLLGDLPPVVGLVRWPSARVTAPNGSPVLCQVDDLGGDGVGPEDELAMLVDAPPGETLYTLVVPATPTPTPAGTVTSGGDAGMVQVDNGLVRVELRAGQGATKRHTIICYHDGEPVVLARSRNDTAKLDDDWQGWRYGDQRVELVASGPVRAVARHVTVFENLRDGKSLELINDYCVWVGRREIESVLRIANTSADQLVLLSYVVTGFYDVSPGGRYEYGSDRFAGNTRDGELAQGELSVTRYHVARGTWRESLWCAAWGPRDDRPPVGLGWIVDDPLHSIYGAVLGDVARGGSHALRMTISYQFRGNTLWPGEGQSFHQWLSPELREHEDTRDLRELRAGVSVRADLTDD